MKVTLLLLILFIFCTSMNWPLPSGNSIHCPTCWRTGHDSLTEQMIPVNGNDALTTENNRQIIHVKFKVRQYGEVSVPININTPEGGEALQADLSTSKFIRITYQSNHELIVQLRQTGVHGGVHPQIPLPANKKYTTVTIPLTDFKGGKTPLDLSDVAKFNFAFLSNDVKDGFDELKISSFTIDGYPQ